MLQSVLIACCSFADSSDLFMSTCANMLGRMIDVVPNGVTLSDVILPIPFKPRDYLLSINPDGTLNLRLVADVSSHPLS